MTIGLIRLFRLSSSALLKGGERTGRREPFHPLVVLYARLPL